MVKITGGYDKVQAKNIVTVTSLKAPDDHSVDVSILLDRDREERILLTGFQVIPPTKKMVSRADIYITILEEVLAFAKLNISGCRDLSRQTPGVKNGFKSARPFTHIHILFKK